MDSVCCVSSGQSRETFHWVFHRKSPCQLIWKRDCIRLFGPADSASRPHVATVSEIISQEMSFFGKPVAKVGLRVQLRLQGRQEIAGRGFPKTSEMPCELLSCAFLSGGRRKISSRRRVGRNCPRSSKNDWLIC
jgi:hypothetical protein